ncbi:hypothetical protein VNO78_11852 [Psophocarpus tetragonolobus]|uniref:Uncharacterized protein n=1 Tax=Psophocarpus tetragonolobus TaxID=3891 RepID=A0AAN9XPD1_PSOTE
MNQEKLGCLTTQPLKTNSDQCHSKGVRAYSSLLVLSSILMIAKKPLCADKRMRRWTQVAFAFGTSRAETSSERVMGWVMVVDYVWNTKVMAHLTDMGFRKLYITLYNSA